MLNKILLSSLLFCTACDPVTIALGGAAAAGTVTVRDKEGITGEISDAYLRKKIEAKLFSKDTDLFDRVELIVKHGIVVVIGSVDDESQIERIKEIVGKVQKDKVYFELHVQPATDAKTFAVDAGITSRINAFLRADGNVSSLNYELSTVRGVVYICGTAMTPYERDVVLNYARTTSEVEKVVSYIVIDKPGEEDN